MSDSRITFLATGNWAAGQLQASWTSTSKRKIVPEVEHVIDETWLREIGRPGIHLFDGPMCRMESFHASPDRLGLTLSPTSYKPFVGTNLHNPHLHKRFGRDVLANPVGVSTVLETPDGFLMLGRRNASVAYYPNRVHPFAGTIEPHDGLDPFATAHRELEEELGLRRAGIGDMRCVGLVEDVTLLQPELIFIAQSTLSRPKIDESLNRSEHDQSWAVAAEEASVSEALKDEFLTPVGVASLLLWGRRHIGASWFDLHRAQFRP